MRARTFALTVALIAPQTVFSETLELIGVHDWMTKSVIGVSGIEMRSDGMGFTAIGDQGWVFEGALQREGAVISDVQITRMAGIIGSDGLPVTARIIGDWSDAEGLAMTEDGRAWIAFERWAHVWQYDDIFGEANWIKDHETFYEFSENRQLEAAAVTRDGTVYAFSEQPLKDGFPIYRLGDDRLWHIDGYLPERDLFAIVGADFDDDGALYILERKLIVGLWWQSRIRRVRLDGSEDATLWTSAHNEYGNLEGISVWKDDSGLRLTLVSDNNGSQSTPTQFVEFRLTD